MLLEQEITAPRSRRERTVPRLEFVEDLRDVGSFRGVLLPALFRKGPHLGSKLFVFWSIWSQVFREQEDHLLIAVRVKRVPPRKYLKVWKVERPNPVPGRKPSPPPLPSRMSTYRTWL